MNPYAPPHPGQDKLIDTVRQCEAERTILQSVMDKYSHCPYGKHLKKCKDPGPYIISAVQVMIQAPVNPYHPYYDKQKDIFKDTRCINVLGKGIGNFPNQYDKDKIVK
jgi:hypothetical protein